MRGDNLFRGLAAKYLQVHGGFTAPTLPPASPFLGDGIAVVANPAAAADPPLECGDLAPLWLGGGADFPGSLRGSLPLPPPSVPGQTGREYGSAAGEPREGEPSRAAEPREGEPSRAEEPGEGSAGVTFTATDPNSVGVVTELLLQRLAGAWRLPKARDYCTQAFVAFTPDQMSVTIEVLPGAYAAAIRFVRAGTGQDSALIPLGVVSVPSSSSLAANI